MNVSIFLRNNPPACFCYPFFATIPLSTRLSDICNIMQGKCGKYRDNGTRFKPVALVAAKDPSSPYLPMMLRIQANLGEMVKNASPVDVVSKAILEAVTNKILNLQY